MQTTNLATSGRVTSRIGLGIATLMREPRKRGRAEVLDAAADLGVRHFDVAPLYGLGRGEPELGRFLHSSGLDDVTVASKFGLAPGKKARLVAPLQGPIRGLMKSSPALRKLGKAAERNSGTVATLGPELLPASVDRSVDMIGRKLDVLILHEVRWTSEWASAWTSIQAGPGYSGLGASGTTDIFNDYPPDVVAALPVLQGPPSASPVVEGAQRIHHSVLSTFAPAIRNRLSALAEAERLSLSEAVDLAWDADVNVMALAVALLLDADDDSIILLGTTRSANLYKLVPMAQRAAANLRGADSSARGLIERLLSAP